MQEFEGRVAVVTGAASGIGLACAGRFAAEGMKVVLADIDQAGLDAAVASLAGAGLDVIGVRTDVSKFEQIQALADRAVEAYGKVNILHSNAGVLRAGALEELTLEDWRWVLAVDLWSVIYGVKVFLPLIRRAGEGHIVNTASTAGLQATANLGPYNVAKSGVVAVTETLRLELEAEGAPVSASVLCPGVVQTRIGDSERHRAATGFAEGAVSASAQAFHQSVAPLIETGMAPADVAGQVIAGIRNNDFWILTHTAWKSVLQDRLAGLLQNRLVTGFGG